MITSGTANNLSHPRPEREFQTPKQWFTSSWQWLLYYSVLLILGVAVVSAVSIKAYMDQQNLNWFRGWIVPWILLACFIAVLLLGILFKQMKRTNALCEETAIGLNSPALQKQERTQPEVPCSKQHSQDTCQVSRQMIRNKGSKITVRNTGSEYVSPNVSSTLLQPFNPETELLGDFAMTESHIRPANPTPPSNTSKLQSPYPTETYYPRRPLSTILSVSSTAASYTKAGTATNSSLNTPAHSRHASNQTAFEHEPNVIPEIVIESEPIGNSETGVLVPEDHVTEILPLSASSHTTSVRVSLRY
jgi:hypothetical protein